MERGPIKKKKKLNGAKTKVRERIKGKQTNIISSIIFAERDGEFNSGDPYTARLSR